MARHTKIRLIEIFLANLEKLEAKKFELIGHERGLRKQFAIELQKLEKREGKK